MKKVAKTLITTTTEFVQPNLFNHLVKRAKYSGEECYIRQSVFLDELIWNGISYMSNKNVSSKSNKHLYLFSMVRKDARNFVKDKDVKLKKKYPVNSTNPKYVNGISKNIKWGGVDLNHAYWRIAYTIGLISENTYLKGLASNDTKVVRLAALSTLGQYRSFKVISEGKETESNVLVSNTNKHKEMEKLRNAYMNIRYICYKHMDNLRKIVGNDFICYQTDCIYFKDKPINRKKIMQYLDKNSLIGKELVQAPKRILSNK